MDLLKHSSTCFSRVVFSGASFSGCPLEGRPETDKIEVTKQWLRSDSPDSNMTLESSDILFPLQPPTPPTPTNPPPVPPRKAWFRSISAPFGSVSAPFGSIWLRFGSVLGPFRVRFGVLGGVGVGSGRGASVREKNITTRIRLTWMATPSL